MTATIKKIEELLAKATPGPWFIRHPQRSFYSKHGVSVGTTFLNRNLENRDNTRDYDNAELICLLRNSIESLLSERKRLREALENIRDMDGIGKADEDIPDDKEDAYRLGSTDTLMDTFGTANKALTERGDE